MVSETAQAELVGHQLFERQPTQGGMTASAQVRHRRGRGRWPVEKTQGRGQGQKPESLQDLPRQPLIRHGTVLVQQRQRLIREQAPRGLLQPFGSRIGGGKGVF